jgi:chromate transport protein ChrA
MTKLKEEFFKILPPTIFFFVALHLLMFIRVLMLEGTGLSPYSSASIAVIALVLGKAVLIADMLPLINRFPNKPLIYNIVWKTVIYLLISAVLHYLERLIDFWRETGSLVAGNQKLLAEIIWPHFWAIQIVFFILIAMYCTVHELVRVIGKEKALQIFFGPMPAPQV